MNKRMFNKEHDGLEYTKKCIELTIPQREYIAPAITRLIENIETGLAQQQPENSSGVWDS